MRSPRRRTSASAAAPARRPALRASPSGGSSKGRAPRSSARGCAAGSRSASSSSRCAASCRGPGALRAAVVSSRRSRSASASTASRCRCCRAALREAHALAPRVPPRAERRRLPARVAAVAAQRGRVALFEGCLMPELFGAVNAATARVLAREGFEVVLPRGPGLLRRAPGPRGRRGLRPRARRRNVAAFAAGEIDARRRELRRLRRGAPRVRPLARPRRRRPRRPRARRVRVPRRGRPRALPARRSRARSATTTPATSSTASASRPRRAGVLARIPGAAPRAPPRRRAPAAAPRASTTSRTARCRARCWRERWTRSRRPTPTGSRRATPAA